MHNCKRCGYESDRLFNLLKHLQRKNSCRPVLENVPVERLIEDINTSKSEDQSTKSFSCDFCEATFPHRQNKYRHQKTCKKNPVNNNTEVLLEKIEQMQKTITELQNDKVNISNTSTNIQNVQNVQNVQNNNVQNNNVHNNNLTFNLRSFGFENIDHLENDLDYMTQCFINKDIMRLLQNIHCDQKHPENQNVRIKSRKHELMEIHEDGRWIVSDQDETLDELLNKGYRIFNMFSYRNKRHLINKCDDGEDEYQELRDWLEDLYSNSNLRKPLKKRLLILFLNNKTVLLEKEVEA